MLKHFFSVNCSWKLVRHLYRMSPFDIVCKPVQNVTIQHCMSACTECHYSTLYVSLYRMSPFDIVCQPVQNVTIPHCMSACTECHYLALYVCHTVQNVTTRHCMYVTLYRTSLLGIVCMSHCTECHYLGALYVTLYK